MAHKTLPESKKSTSKQEKRKMVKTGIKAKKDPPTVLAYVKYGADERAAVSNKRKIADLSEGVREDKRRIAELELILLARDNEISLLEGAIEVLEGPTGNTAGGNAMAAAVAHASRPHGGAQRDGH